MPWFRAVTEAWVYERAERNMSRNAEANQSLQLNIRPVAYKRAFLTHRNTVTPAGRWAAGMPCTMENEKKRGLTS